MSNKEKEPIFEGNFKDFKKYFGGYVRNSVQDITNKYKVKIEECEYAHCKKKNKKHPNNEEGVNLQAAHKKENTREDIIQQALVDCNNNEKETTDDFDEDKTRLINLNIFNMLNKIYHTDPENYYFLCEECHNALDERGKVENRTKNFNKKDIKRTNEKDLLEISSNAYIDMLFSVLNEKCLNGEKIEKILKHKKLDKIANKNEFENTKKIFAEKKSKKDASMQLKKYFDNKIKGNKVKNNLKDYLIEHYKIEHEKYINKHFKNKKSSDKS